MIGDLARKVNAEPQKILDAIGSDSRVGTKCTMYGYGYGGPCFPRDNRALGIYAKEKMCAVHISDATDECNKEHLNFMKDNYEAPKEGHIFFNTVTYKPQSTMIEESQQLQLAVELAHSGYTVTITEREEVISEVKKLHGDLFKYVVRL